MIIEAKIIGDNITYDKSREGGGERGQNGYVMSRSEVMEFARNPRRWLDGFGLKDEGTDATQWGSLIDSLVMSTFDSQFAVAPEVYPDAKTGESKPFTLASKSCKEWAAAQNGRQIVKKPLMDEAAKAVEAIRADAAVSDLLQSSRKQMLVTAKWKDKETGMLVPLCALIDMVPSADHAEFGKVLADFKTTRNGDPATWGRVVDDSGYDMQAALYLDLYTAASGEDRTDWVFAVQENVPPYHVVKPLPALTSEFIQWGRLKYQTALKFYCQCLKGGVWPSYRPTGILYGNIQLLGPENLWRYRELAGQGSLNAPIESCD